MNNAQTQLMESLPHCSQKVCIPEALVNFIKQTYASGARLAKHCCQCQTQHSLKEIQLTVMIMGGSTHHFRLKCLTVNVDFQEWFLSDTLADRQVSFKG